MRELEKQILQPENITLEKQKDIKKGVKYVGNLKLEKGLKFFELDTKTMLIKEADVKEVAVDIGGNVRKKFILKENCLYAPALNIKNAERKFLKMI